MASSNDSLDNTYHIEKIGDTIFEIPKRYTNLARIGNGAQGVCCKAFDSLSPEQEDDDKYVVIKKLNRPFATPTGAKRAYREIRILSLTNHENVIKLLNLFTPQEDINTFTDVYTVTKFMDADFGQVVDMRLDHERISYLLYQMLCGLKHLHSGGIIHRDLKPQNIVVNRNCQLKILDFGLARNVQDIEMTQYVVTRYYRSPEIILGLPYKENADIWSVGCIFGEMIKKGVVFPGQDSSNQYRMITEVLGSPSQDFIKQLPEEIQRYVTRMIGTYPKRPLEQIFPDRMFPPDSSHHALNSENARDLLSKMLVIDPRERITVDDALDHPYINVCPPQANEVDGPPIDYKSVDEERDINNVDVWKEMIFELVKEYRANRTF